MKKNPPFYIYLRSTIIEADKKLLVIKDLVGRKKIINNFLCSFTPILESWLASREKFQVLLNDKWQVHFKLPEHFESYFVYHIYSLKKLGKGRKIMNLPEFPVTKKANKIIGRSADYRKNNAGEIALILLIEYFYFCFFLWVESWAPNNMIDKTKSVHQHHVLLGNNEMRLSLLLILEKQMKKSRKYSLREVEEAKEIFQQLLSKLFSK